MIASKNYLALVGLCLIYSPTYAMMFINYGYRASYDHTINAYKCINEGILEGFETMTIKATSLSGNGTIRGKHVIINCDECKVSGTIAGNTECTITARKIDDAGTISGGRVIIRCDEFGFRGTLSCTNKCVIYAKQDFDYSMFKRNGSGRVTIIITKDEIDLVTEEALVSRSFQTLHTRCLSLIKEDFDDLIKKTRTTAVLNLILEKNMLEKLKRKIEAEAKYYKERLNQKRDPQALLKGMVEVGLGSIGLLGAGLIFKNNQALAQKFGVDRSYLHWAAGLTGGIASIPVLASYFAFYEWLNPCYKEKYEKHLMIIDCIDNALKTTRIPEEKITTL